MKRILLPLALAAFAALVVAACAPAPSSNTNANMSNMNISNANAANTNMGAAAWTNDDAISNERQAWDFVKTKNYDAFAALLADAFIDVEPEKVYDKAGTIAVVKTFDLTDVTLSDFKVLKLDNDAAVVTYSVAMKGKVGGKEIPADAPPERHTTAKLFRNGKWLAFYHQGTPVMKMPQPNASPASANANSANANKAATAAATPAATTADVEANERAVWDAIKSKNYDAFAGYLAEDSLEVEPDQVSTKAESVKGVQMFDASKFALSEFKTVAIDDDAKIVTYTVKGPGPGGKEMTERHSTVWINRGGKWMAAFHQGTPVAPGM